jgi:hypothetical protein
MGEMHDLYGRWDENGEFNPFDGEPDDPSYGQLAEAYERFEAGAQLTASERDVIRRNAHGAVAKAIAAGKLARPDRCEDCRRRRTTQAHHESYIREMWLEVEWLCHACHAQRHDRVDVWSFLRVPA